MDIYLGMVIFLLFSSLVIHTVLQEDFEKQKRWILGINIFLLWLLCVLKKETVGTDILGYKKIYELSAKWRWLDFTKVYFEEGYTFLMQLFSKNGASFQVFNAFVYTLIYVPWFVFLNRYSKQPTLSLLIYICYQFWVFNMSGLRQGIAMSMCLMAYILLEEKSWKRRTAFCVIVFAASTIHRSALIFLIALGKDFFRPGWKTMTVFGFVYAGSVVFRGRIVSLVNRYAGRYQVSHSMTLGGSFIMLVGFTVFAAVILFLFQRQVNDIETDSEMHYALKPENDMLFMMLSSIALNLMLNGSNMLRAASYASMFLTVSLPNCLSKCDNRSRLALNTAVGVFLLTLFYHDVLIPNQLNIIPYRVFWQ